MSDSELEKLDQIIQMMAQMQKAIGSLSVDVQMIRKAIAQEKK